jgi:hypothetical protein
LVIRNNEKCFTLTLPSPLKGEEYRKNISSKGKGYWMILPLKEERVSEESSLKGEGI